MSCPRNHPVEYKVLVYLSTNLQCIGERRQRPLIANFIHPLDVKAHLELVKKFNKNWKTIVVQHKGKEIAKWQNPNFGT